ncbi:sugar ABC transporter ATP-binding protein [Nocardia higoensis]|uniref:sugar ABC transporter ATP-binding protein n=1 Tax=Nocardia higoensis TaxID=228599 RepID=UPI00031B8539|nr:sugar ABC transporter ATP-binding protein [Nocardia higoensis]
MTTGGGGFAVHGLRKSYGGLPVLRGVDLTVEPGEIHALLGANGAGKSTLIKCLSGAESPDAGEIMVRGRRQHDLTPRVAREAGVAVIHQTPSLTLTLDVADNIFLGNEPTRGPWLRNRRRAVARSAELLSELGSDIAPDADLRSLGNAELAVIEIAKALAREPAVLILDEPTASLTEREVVQLAVQMRRLRDRGLPLLFVTHRLTEALELADRVTVLRGGEVVLNSAAAELSKDDLVAAIVGPRSASVLSRRARRPAGVDTSPRLDVRDLSGPGVGPVRLRVAPGEIVGLFGLVGAGRTELLETLAGARRRSGGQVFLDGRRVTHRSPGDAIADGVALVPSDRLRKSIFATLSGETNVMVSRLSTTARYGLVRSRAAERATFSRTAKSLGLWPSRGDLDANRYSGGNQQKLVIGRWLNGIGTVRLLLLDEPTDGVDVGARDELYAAVREFAGKGGAVLLASSEPEELMAVADRVVVLARGRVAGELGHESLDEHGLLRLAHAGEADVAAPSAAALESYPYVNIPADDRPVPVESPR